MSRPAPPPSLLPAEWRVDLPVFEGPLDLLLHLVKIHEVPITEIPVAQVCDQFHEYLRLMEELNLDIAGEYIYEAAQLIHIKSKMLLPQKKKKDDEEEEDPREDLIQRLLEYQRMKDVAQSLAEVDSLRRGVWTPEPRPLDLPEPEPEVDLGDVSLYDLLGALKEAMERYDRDHPPPFRTRRASFSVQSQVQRLLGLLDPGRPFELLEDLKNLSCRAEAIASFLAILELARLQLVRLHQTEDGEILLYRTTRDAQADELEAIGA